MYSQSRSGHRFKTAEAKQWEEAAGYLLLKHKRFGERKVGIKINYTFSDNRSDLGNRTKILLDLLQKVGIIENDNQVWKLIENKAIDKSNPKVEFEIWEIDNG